jgi:hypothetical protein
MSKKKRAKKHKLILNWEYCECGCHQHAANLAGIHYSIYNDLQGTYYLGIDTHRAYDHRSPKFKSMADADKAAATHAEETIVKTRGIVSEKEVRKLIRRAQRLRKGAEQLMQTYLGKKDDVGYEGAMKEAAAFGIMEQDLKKLCEAKT